MPRAKKRVEQPPKAAIITHERKPHDGARGHVGQMTWLRACLSPLYSVVSLAVGRQVGKTSLMDFLDVEEGARTQGRYVSAYVAQGHPQAMERFDVAVENWKAAGLVKRVKSSQGQDRFIDVEPFGLNHGARYYYVSGDVSAHAGFAGKTLNRAKLDECSLLPAACYTSTIRPMLNVTKGKSLLAGSPYPEGLGWAWFQDIFDKGVMGSETYNPSYISFNCPSEASPFNSAEWLAEQRATCRTKAEEMAQYDGLFVKDSGAVFSNLDAVFSIHEYRNEGNLWVSEDREPGISYVAGIDYGKHNDYTVVSIFRMDSCRQVALAKMQGDYTQQLVAIERLVNRYGDPYIYAEGREGAGLINELLRVRHSTRMREIKWTRGGVHDKESAVLRGVDFCQRGAWKLMSLKEQKEEFRLFMREPIGENSTGFRYQAPASKHDDFVAANLYAAYGLPLADPVVPTATEILTDKSAGYWEWLVESQRILPGASGVGFNLRD